MARRLQLDLPRFQARYRALQEEVAELAAESGHPSPRIVVVSKYVDRGAAARLREAGFGPLGENRAQELADKAGVHEDRDGWHFIGHLQRNKIPAVVPRVSLFHALDAPRLAQALDRWVEEHDPKPFDCLVQVNVAGEESKRGLAPFEAESSILEWIETLPHLRIRGLMTMAPLIPEEECQGFFRALRELRDQIREALPERPGALFNELSMGMSNDYRAAVREGATILRIGRTLYE